MCPPSIIQCGNMNLPLAKCRVTDLLLLREASCSLGPASRPTPGLKTVGSLGPQGVVRIFTMQPKGMDAGAEGRSRGKKWKRPTIVPL